MYCLLSTSIGYFKRNRLLNVLENSICTFRTHGVNFIIYNFQLLASSWWIYKYAFVFLKLAVLGNERNLSSQSKEAGSWLFYYKCPCNSQDIMNTMLSSLHFTHNLRRKLKELYSYTPSGWQTGLTNGSDRQGRTRLLILMGFWSVMVWKTDEWNTHQHSSLHWWDQKTIHQVNM